ncbi:MAG: flagellar export protein FliJ [Rhodoferax sp.]|nr:flagellar export protein FliJ [Rhodoferax sp.]
MTAHKSILLAIDLASAQRDQAQSRLQQARQADAFAHAQMQQLIDYLQETEQRWLNGARTSVAPEMLRHHYQFVARLIQAIGLQEGVLKGSQQRLDLAHQELLGIELRLASFKQLLATRRASLAQRQQRSEQKQMDEFATLLVQRQRQLQAENI